MAATPVREEQAHFRNGDIELAGTLFLPAGTRARPAVVIFHGSGPEARNEFMGRWFAEQGVTALTYDKRGVGESAGDFRVVPFMDLAGDGLAGIAYLKGRAEIDATRIGVWGLSQGGWLGPLAASQSKDVAFVIAVSGPGVSPGEQMIFYYGNQLRDAGIPEEQVTEASNLRRRVWRYLSTGQEYEEARKALEQGQSRPWFAALKEQRDGLFHKSPAAILQDKALRAGQWFRMELNYDPRVALRRLKVPALFLFGDQDELVPVARSVAIIRQTLEESGHRDFTIQIFPGADHGLHVQAAGGRPQFAAGYLEVMRDWLHKKVAAGVTPH